MIIHNAASIGENNLTEAFEKLFAGLHGELGAIICQLQKAIHHWDNVSASYDELVDFVSLFEPVPLLPEQGNEDTVTSELFKLAELNRSLEALYQQARQDRMELAAGLPAPDASLAKAVVY